MKKLYLSKKDRKIAGVCGGLAEYFEIDSVVVRVLFVFLLVFTGFAPGIVFYILAALIIPKQPNQNV